MKKIILLMLLVTSTNTMAEWATVGTFYGDNYYYDTQSIVRNGNKVKMWSLFDYKAVQTDLEKGYLSILQHNEYDCDNKTSNLLDVSLYAQNMGVGEVVIHEANMQGDPTSIAPNTIQDVFWKKACIKDIPSISTYKPVIPSPEWTKYSDGNEFTSYISHESIKRKGSQIKAWVLFDYKTAQYSNKDEGNLKFFSIKMHYEFDCKEETSKILDMSAHSENAGYGNVVYQLDNIKQEPVSISPASRGRTLLNIACGKK